MKKVKFIVIIILVGVFILGLWKFSKSLVSIGADTSSIVRGTTEVSEKKDKMSEENKYDLHEDLSVEDRSLVSTKELLEEFYDLEMADYQYQELDNGESCIVIESPDLKLYVFCSEDGYPYRFGKEEGIKFTEEEKEFFTGLNCVLVVEGNTEYFEGV